jgi:diketogulonate reductase-like aldo/keto reductase
MIARAIPATGEMLPAVGLGTWQAFDIGASPAEREPRREVLKRFVQLGGSVVDSSPMYGKAEGVVGELAAETGVASKLFVATKVWTSGRAAGVDQMERSMKLLRAARLDLMQVHNLVDCHTHLATLREWQQAGRVRYVGVTHYTASGYAELERVLGAEPVEFVQLNYSLEEREAERRLLRSPGTAALRSSSTARLPPARCCGPPAANRCRNGRARPAARHGPRCSSRGFWATRP